MPLLNGGLNPSVRFIKAIDNTKIAAAVERNLMREVECGVGRSASLVGQIMDEVRLAQHEARSHVVRAHLKNPFAAG
jgi:hypothetical protein